jgi:hypothetical protein
VAQEGKEHFLGLRVGVREERMGSELHEFVLALIVPHHPAGGNWTGDIWRRHK